MSASIDLSKAVALKEVAFHPKLTIIEWVTRMLQTITPEHRDLRQITIFLPPSLTSIDIGANIRHSLGEVTSGWWSDLDHLLVQFWDSHLIRPRVGWHAGEGGRGANTEYCISCLFPEITKRGIVEMA